ncbi:MAG: hypothetical protein HFH38_11775 [Lachnospiraceae bacterium]|jgi:multidrug efflux pump subunit AcrA (membrane-fusion protein)|nr:hypothetical protein [Lachnospiraceae bacterium]
MVRKKAFGIFGGFLAVMLVFTLISRAVSGAAMARVTTVKLSTGTIDHKVSGSGKVEAGKEVAVYTEGGQRVKEICVQEGQAVEQGETLFLLDLGRLEEQILAAQQELEKIRLQDQDAKSSRESQQETRALAKKRAAEDYNQAVSQGDADVAKAKAAWDAAERALQEFLQNNPRPAGIVGAAYPNGMSACAAKKAANTKGGNGAAEAARAVYEGNRFGNPEKGSWNQGNQANGSQSQDSQEEGAQGSPVQDSQKGGIQGSPVQDSQKGGTQGSPVQVSQEERKQGSEVRGSQKEGNQNSQSRENQEVGIQGSPSQDNQKAGNQDSQGQENQEAGTQGSSNQGNLEEGMQGSPGEDGQNEALGSPGQENQSQGDSAAEWDAQKSQLEASAAEAKAAYEAAVTARIDSIRSAARAVEDAAAAAPTDSTAAQNEILKKQQELALSKLQTLQEEGGKVTAPVSGMVTEIAVTTGDFTTEGTAVRLADTSQGNRLVATVSKSNEAYVQKGSQVTISPSGSKDKLKDFTVSNVSANKEDNTLLDIFIELPKGVLEPGASAQIEIVQKSAQYSSVIPVQALHEEQTGYYVLILREQQGVMGQELAVERMDVQVLDKNGTVAALEEGVLTGEQEIISTASRSIEDGSRVRREQ